jgi:hypothetical protein
MVGAKIDVRLGFQSRQRAAARGILFPDHFLNSWGRDSRSLMAEHLFKLAPGVTEILGHPADDGPELRAYDSDNPEIRVGDALCFTDPNVKRMIEDAGVVTTSFRPLRDLQRSAARQVV